MAVDCVLTNSKVMLELNCIMSRTYKNAPEWDYIDPDHSDEKREAFCDKKEEEYLEMGYSPFEARWKAISLAGTKFPQDYHYGREVPEKDCFTWNKPKAFTQHHNRRMRHHTKQMLTKMVNEQWDPEEFDAEVYPHPREYKEYYW